MKFPWHLYKELPLSKRNTVQAFITNRCNLKCPGCFVKDVMAIGTNEDMSLIEFSRLVERAIEKGAEQINILGGEPLLHNRLNLMCLYAKEREMKVTIYTNGVFLHKFPPGYFHGATIRVSIYHTGFGPKGIEDLYKKPIQVSFDANYMIGADTRVIDLLHAAAVVEKDFGCNVFFISSLRDLSGGRDFFTDTASTMPVLKYKELVHNFLYQYAGGMEIHISKRGVFESTLSLPHRKCKFANQFIGGAVVQCPFDIVNGKWQPDYEFDTRNCQHNSTCLMSKIKVKRK